jgi:GntR family transcriptional regulator / MocR family aminotransferase
MRRPRRASGVGGKMIGATQMETVKAALAEPAFAAMPLHGRVHAALRRLIVGGGLKANFHLPSSRGLAASLDLSRDTVEKAYLQLHAEGLITRTVGRGSVVSAETDAFTRWKRPDSKQVKRASFEAEAALSLLSERGRLIAATGGLRNRSARQIFAPGVPEIRMFPTSDWQRLQRQVLRDLGSEALGHGDPQGASALRSAISDYLNLERGGQARADNILILTSAQQAFALCAILLCDRGDEIFVENPGYGAARGVFESAGLKLTPTPVDAGGLRFDQLSQSPRRGSLLYLTPSHQYPTGVTLNFERRLGVIEWANCHQAWIIEDDYDGEFHYDGRPVACIQGLDSNKRTLYVGTFSKSTFPGLRIAYMVLPENLVEAMTSARSLIDGYVSTLNQLTLARFIDGGHFGRHVQKMRRLYRARRDALAQAMDKYLAGVATFIVPQGGLQGVCVLTGEISEADSIRAAAQSGLQLNSLSQLFIREPAEKGWLLGFGALSPTEIEEAVSRLAKALREARP